VSATLDTNVLLYASDTTSPFHGRALDVVEEFAAGPDLVYVFWPVVTAYIRIATHPAVFDQPLSLEAAATNIETLIARPHVRTPGEETGFWDLYRAVTADAGARGNLVADAHLVALMRQNGVRTIWTHDRDFRKFDGIAVRDPFA
jgi:uncharacterized protein